MKVVNTCLFSEAHEADVLEVKLNCESEGVDEWVFIQSPWSFRGEYKGTCLEQLLEQDRFSPFKQRIHIITIGDNLFEKVGKEHGEAGYFQVEHASRMNCSDYIFNHYSDNDRVIVSDVDEVLDMSRPSRRDEIFQIFNSTDRDLNIPQIKYWWNFSNMSCYPKELPIRTIASLKNGWKYFRNEGCERVNASQLLSMEYSYCFDFIGNMRKCSTFSHDRYESTHITKAFMFNTWHKRNHESLSQAWDFFETIELTQDNSPDFVLENFNRLDTKTIDPDYAINRQRHLGMGYPHPCESNGMLGTNRVDRRYHFMRRKK